MAGKWPKLLQKCRSKGQSRSSNVNGPLLLDYGVDMIENDAVA